MPCFSPERDFVGLRQPVLEALSPRRCSRSSTRTRTAPATISATLATVSGVASEGRTHSKCSPSSGVPSSARPTTSHSLNGQIRRIEPAIRPTSEAMVTE